MQKNRINCVVYIITILFIIFSITSLMRTIFDIKGSSLNDFLSYLSSIPQIDLDLTVSSYVIKSSWGAFNFLRNFINVFGYAVGIVQFLGVNLFNTLLSVFYLIGYVFV